MTTIFAILIVVACIILAFFILVQNPKGGGLSGTFGAASSQVMGVKQSGDVMEKGTWILITSLSLLCIVSVASLKKPEGSSNNKSTAAPATQSAPAKKGK